MRAKRRFLHGWWRALLLWQFSCSCVYGVLSLEELQRAIYPVAFKARETTVAVNWQGSTGSGVVVSEDGLILTAGHVVSDIEGELAAREVTILFEDGEEERATVLGINRRYDAAMLKLQGNKKWPFAELGDSQSLSTGAWVIAAGHPSGYDELRAAPLRFGRVTAKHLDYFLGSDCVLFGGDSGGALFDLKGRVVGIHSWIGENVEVNTHAGVSGFLSDWENLKKEGYREGSLLPPPRLKEGSPVLGVVFEPERRGRNVILTGVVPDSAAERAGLRADDIILRVDGQGMGGSRLKQYLQQLEGGDEILLEYRRGKDEHLTKVKLGKVAGLPFVTEEAQELLDRQANDVFSAFGKITNPLKRGSVRLYSRKAQRGYGTIWKGNHILAKASEVQRFSILEAVSELGKRYHLRLDRVYREHDLVVYRVEGAGEEFEPIPPVRGGTDAGTLIAAVRPDGNPEGLAVASVRSRNLLESSRGYLGVELDLSYEGPGALVRAVTEGSAAEEAGMLEEDVIMSVDKREIDSVGELRTVLMRAGQGQQVVLEIRRRTGPVTLTANLKGREFEGRQRMSRRQRMMNEMDERGLSERRDKFPSVIQTDMTLAPEEMGLPVVDIDGKLVGMVIARAGRVNTYILPSELLESLFE